MDDTRPIIDISLEVGIEMSFIFLGQSANNPAIIIFDSEYYS